MRATIRCAVALMTTVGVCLVPMLPPEHLHRAAVGDRHAVLIHRHVAPHTTPNGTHIERPGVEEGAPQWLADPQGAVPRPPADTWGVIPLLWHSLVPPLRSANGVSSPSETLEH